MGISLQIKNLEKSFNSKKILKDVNIEVKSGESMVLLGKSGCGKSVLLKSIANVVTPSSGEIILNNRDINKITSKERKSIFDSIGILFQEIGLFDSMNVWENVAFYNIVKLSQKKEEAKKNAINALENMKISKLFADLPISEVSLGMQKRIGLARLLTIKPDLILLDEPTSGLDGVTSANTGKIILENIKKNNCTTFTVTHDMSLAKTIGDRIALMNNGKIEWIGSKEEIDDPKNKIIQNFINGIDFN